MTAQKKGKNFPAAARTKDVKPYKTWRVLFAPDAVYEINTVGLQVLV